jgi:hypothetical protein
LGREAELYPTRFRSRSASSTELVGRLRHGGLAELILLTL